MKVVNCSRLSDYLKLLQDIGETLHKQGIKFVIIKSAMRTDLSIVPRDVDVLVHKEHSISEVLSVMKEKGFRPIQIREAEIRLIKTQKYEGLTDLYVDLYFRIQYLGVRFGWLEEYIFRSPELLDLEDISIPVPQIEAEFTLNALHSFLGHNLFMIYDFALCNTIIGRHRRKILSVIKNNAMIGSWPSWIPSLIGEYVSIWLDLKALPFKHRVTLLPRPVYSKTLLRTDFEFSKKVLHLVNYFIIAKIVSTYKRLTKDRGELKYGKRRHKFEKIAQAMLFAFEERKGSSHGIKRK